MINHTIFTDIEHSIVMSLRAAYLSMHRLSDANSMKHGVTEKRRKILEKIWEETKTLRNRFLSVFSIKEIEILTSQLKLIADVMK